MLSRGACYPVRDPVHHGARNPRVLDGKLAVSEAAPLLLPVLRSHRPGMTDQCSDLLVAGLVARHTGSVWAALSATQDDIFTSPRAPAGLETESHVRHLEAMATMLERERELYDSKIQEWYPTRSGQFVVIKDAEIVGFFGSIDLALEAAASRFGLTSCLVREIRETQPTASIPALTLGLLHAHP